MVNVSSRPAAALARAAGRISRRLGQGGGTSLPGKVLLRLSPDALSTLGSRLPQGIAMISGTNGKTTTTRMLVECLEGSGEHVATNHAGANLLSGVATALLDSTAGATVGCFEVDEFALPAVIRAMPSRALGLMNLFRDQLDRYGELEEIADRWQAMLGTLPQSTTLALNADDPLVASLEFDASRVIFFGLEDVKVGLPKLPHAADSVRCRRCGSSLQYDLVLVGHLGHWRCPDCGWSRPTPRVRVDDIQLRGVDGSSFNLLVDEEVVRVDLTLPGVHNIANAAAAAALAVAMGMRVDAIGDALSATGAAFGRAERVRVGDRELVVLLAKNPTGANENLRTVALETGPIHVLMSLEDRIADGRDISWIWDVDLDDMLPRLASLTLSGARAHDLALRVRYSGIPVQNLSVQPHPGRALDHALGQVGTGGRLYALPTYTAMLDLRAILDQRGVTTSFWSGA